MAVREVLDNNFYEQIALPYAIEKAGLACRALPMRFNFPNDPVAEAQHPEEAGQIVNIHYLRTKIFDRHRIFADAVAFRKFIEMPLTGSNATFRTAIKKLTGAVYPF